MQSTHQSELWWYLSLKQEAETAVTFITYQKLKGTDSTVRHQYMEERSFQEVRKRETKKEELTKRQRVTCNAPR